METKLYDDFVFLISMPYVPGIEEVDDIISKILATSGRIVVHAKHTKPGVLMPDWKVIMHILHQLNFYSDEVHNRLIGTIIQTRRLDDFTKSFIQMVLTLYRPKKPLCITDNKEDVRIFLLNIKEAEKKNNTQ